ncbi:MAG: hypothetical protein GY895_15785 [Phycisphaera sp.]|nr:hypothetical protein [Phycisphaera sp.]
MDVAFPVILATMLGSISLLAVLGLRISGECVRTARLARVRSEADAIIEARRLAADDT